METSRDVSVVVVERLNEGVVVEFTDGLCAFYTDELLYETLPLAELLDRTATVW